MFSVILYSTNPQQRAAASHGSVPHAAVICLSPAQAETVKPLPSGVQRKQTLGLPGLGFPIAALNSPVAGMRRFID